MIQKKLTGTGVAIVTPFRNDSSIDFAAFKKLINYVIENGVNYIVVLGTTGESVTLNKEEKIALINYANETIDGKVPLIVGIGANNTQEVLNCINNFDFDGVEAILSVSPYYNKPTQEGIYQHYKIIANTCPVPVILYNVPGRTGINITSETTIKLSKHKNICAIKEASGNFHQIMEIIKSADNDFIVISGDDAITLPLISIGVKGVISVIANGLPKEFSTMVNLALEGKFKEANKINLKLLDIYSNLFIEGNPGGIKALLNILKLVENNLRLPLVPVSKKTYQRLAELVSLVKI
ncbi:MAG: 4-hydroxy-tetrahydrodipicolinate synthase [Bacteroidales bacterium]|nr:4-hydroxy-tetrahydrodipicolinate synthase [Bacteroidales bacterium]